MKSTTVAYLSFLYRILILICHLLLNLRCSSVKIFPNQYDFGNIFHRRASNVVIGDDGTPKCKFPNQYDFGKQEWN